MDANQLESVSCTNCGKHFKFPVGTLTAAGKSNFRCTGCATSTLEANVQTHAQSGKKLLTEG
jgi:tRNA(Ile2) C34 agmatinyltransferase TiaS